MEANFNINIRDNFFDKNTFTELYDKIPYLQYQPDQNMIDGIPHIWFSATVDPQLAVSIKERCEKTFNKKLTLRFCSYTMLATVEPAVHRDYDEEKTSHQVIIYIKGNTDLHKGTGFYIKSGDGLELNTHVGFVENRAVFWDSKAYHSPLNFTAEDKTKRFSIIAQYKETT
tara:strand:+ start:86 stop:598 length:513 start_codon:yes stop_codon:yes gene_type:complete